MTTRHLIAFVDFTFLCDVHSDEAVDARWQFIVVFTRKDADIDNLTRFTMRNAQGRIPYFPFLITENSPQESFFRRQFCFAFRRNFTDENIAREYVSTDHDDTFFIEVFRAVFADIRDFACNFFRAELRITGIAFIFFDMDGCIQVVLRQIFTQQNGVFVVITFPRHVSDEDIIA